MTLELLEWTRKAESSIASMEGVETCLLASPRGLVKVIWVSIREDMQGRGYGSAAMERLCAMADEAGVTLALDVAEAGTPYGDRLTAWYETLGFAVNTSPHIEAELIRAPKD